MFSLALAITVALSGAPDKPDRGWFFYEEPPKKEKKKLKPQKQKVLKPITKQTKTKEKDNKGRSPGKGFRFPVRPDAPPVVKEFLLNPNEKTAKAFLEWQAKYFNHLRTIGYSLREAYLKYGPQIYNVAGYPETPLFADLYNSRKNFFFARILRKFKNKLGFIFFYKEGCSYCEVEKRNVLTLYELGLSIRGVSSDKIDSKLPFKNVVAPQLFDVYGIRSVPTLIAVFEKDNGDIKTAVVGRGLTPLDQIERNTLMFLASINEFKLKDFNPNYKGFFGEPVDVRK